MSTTATAQIKGDLSGLMSLESEELQTLLSDSYSAKESAEKGTQGAEAKKETTPAKTEGKKDSILDDEVEEPQLTEEEQKLEAKKEPAKKEPVKKELSKEEKTAADEKIKVEAEKKLTDAIGSAKEGLTKAKTKAEKTSAQKSLDEATKALELHNEEKPFVAEFKLPDEQKASEGEGNGWKELAKELTGKELTEDSYDEFTKNVEDYYKNKYEVQLGKYEPETQRFIEFLEAKGTIEEFLNPLKPIQELQSLSSEDLVRTDLEHRKWKPELIEQELIDLQASGKLELSAHKIRETLSKIEADTKQNIITSKTSAENRKNTFKQTTSAEELSSIKKSLNTVSDFMETPITDKHRDFITKNWESGKYAKDFDDPKVKAEFLLWREFGKTGISNLKNKSLNEAKLKYKNDRHNIPPVPGSGTGKTKSSSKPTQSAEGNWQALEGFKDAMMNENAS